MREINNVIERLNELVEEYKDFHGYLLLNDDGTKVWSKITKGDVALNRETLKTWLKKVNEFNNEIGKNLPQGNVEQAILRLEEGMLVYIPVLAHHLFLNVGTRLSYFYIVDELKDLHIFSRKQQKSKYDVQCENCGEFFHEKFMFEVITAEDESYSWWCQGCKQLFARDCSSCGHSIYIKFMSNEKCTFCNELS